jgi:hypothetical protein
MAGSCPGVVQDGPDKVAERVHKYADIVRGAGVPRLGPPEYSVRGCVRVRPGGVSKNVPLKKGARSPAHPSAPSTQRAVFPGGAVHSPPRAMDTALQQGRWVKFQFFRRRHTRDMLVAEVGWWAHWEIPSVGRRSDSTIGVSLHTRRACLPRPRIKRSLGKVVRLLLWARNDGAGARGDYVGHYYGKVLVRHYQVSWFMYSRTDPQKHCAHHSSSQLPKCGVTLTTERTWSHTCESRSRPV